ncbi:MAG: hypothetical protein KC582_02570 [Candidatus Magasanikbacteria bacterium]|nr:hypothetical protein [Candidatus Magasanikbacteria bacterium]
MTKVITFDQEEVIRYAHYLHERNMGRLDFCISLRNAFLRVYDDNYAYIATYPLTDAVELYKTYFLVPRDYWLKAIEAVDIRPAELKAIQPLWP